VRQICSEKKHWMAGKFYKFGRDSAESQRNGCGAAIAYKISARRGRKGAE